MTSSKSAPKDAGFCKAILKDMGIIEYEPRVVNQMLEFTYRYITNILEDARVFSNHAKKKNLDIEDVKLAIQMQMDKGFATPPPRDILIDISRQRNNTPLPLIKPHCGPRLPPDRYCLSACNYRLKSSKRTVKGLPPKLNLQTAATVTTKITPAVNLSSKSGASLALVTKGLTSPTVTFVTRSSVTYSHNNAIPTTVKLGATPTPSPFIKITPGQSTTATISSSSIGSISSNLNVGSASSNNGITAPSPSITKVPVLRTIVTAAKPSTETPNDASGKRKREEDDDYDAE